MNNGRKNWIRYDPSHRPVILAVLAHPDDESFGMGGTLALYARRGARVYLICATRGEAGDVEEEHLKGFEDKAARRESELRCAAALLGLEEVIFLGYRDSGMEGSADNQHPESLYQADLDAVAARIAHVIRRLQPDVVVTFDPIGGYRHPDHIKCHLATVQAFTAAPDATLYPSPENLPGFQPAKLYFHTMPHVLLRFMVRIMPLIGRDPTKFGRNQDIDLKSIVEVSFPIHARIDYRSVANLRDQAAQCHQSQGGGLTGGNKLVSAIRNLFAAKDTYMRAYPEPNGEKTEHDLLEGLNFPA